MNAFDIRTTPIRTRSIRNVEDERLLGRLEGLREILIEHALDFPGSRMDYSHRVAEARNIEDELNRRDVHHRPVTRREYD